MSAPHGMQESRSGCRPFRALQQGLLHEAELVAEWVLHDRPLQASAGATCERLVQHRRGRTTLLTSTSVIALQGADEVHLLVDGRVVATGPTQRSWSTIRRTTPLFARGDPEPTDRRRRGAFGAELSAQTSCHLR
jgi:hypothetical protein